MLKKKKIDTHDVISPKRHLAFIDSPKSNGGFTCGMIDEGPGSISGGQVGPMMSGPGMITRQQDDSNQRPQYSMPGILHFLQTEWARFEMERSQWEVERAELQVKILHTVAPSSHKMFLEFTTSRMCKHERRYRTFPAQNFFVLILHPPSFFLKIQDGFQYMQLSNQTFVFLC